MDKLDMPGPLTINALIDDLMINPSGAKDGIFQENPGR